MKWNVNKIDVILYFTLQGVCISSSSFCVCVMAAVLFYFVVFPFFLFFYRLKHPKLRHRLIEWKNCVSLFFFFFLFLSLSFSMSCFWLLPSFCHWLYEIRDGFASACLRLDVFWHYGNLWSFFFLFVRFPFWVINQADELPFSPVKVKF